MPLRKPKEGESQSAYMQYCMHELGQSDTDRPQDQMVAICLEQWRSKHPGAAKPKNDAEVARIIANWKEILKAGAPEPHKGESYDGFMTRCKKESDEHACETSWNEWVRGQEKKPGKWDPSSEHSVDPARLKRVAKADVPDTPDPEDDESHEDFVDRCVADLTSGDTGLSDDDAEDACEAAWDDYQQGKSGSNGIVQKEHVTVGKGMEFVLSDATPDRFGDIVQVEGWEFANFTRNPVALFSHRADFPIGTWTGIRIHDKALRGNLILAPKGISSRIDEIRGLVEAGILRAVSVGFKPLSSHPIDGTKNDPFGMSPQIYTKSELVEVSLVAIPANPNALAVAKSLNLSPEVQRLVFAEHGNKNMTGGTSTYYARTRAATGNKRTQVITATSGKTSPNRRTQQMLLSDRIVAAEKFKVELQDQLTAHLDTVDDQNPDDALQAVTEDLNQKIANAERNLANLKQAELRLAKATSDRGNDLRRELIKTTPADPPRPFAMAPPKNKSAVEYLIRQGVIAAVMHTRHMTPDQAQQFCGYGEDACTKAYVDYCEKAASAVAMTSVAGWAAELAQTVYGDFLQLLAPSAVMPALAAKGLALTFGRAGKIVIPARAATPSLAGSFVGEGAPIPVRQGAFTTIQLVPKKLGVITTYTREIGEHSIPAIEGILRDSVAQDTSVAIDTVLLDANAATAIRPPGLRNGVAGLTPTAGGGYTAFIGDLKALAGALLTATAGHLRSPVFIMNPQQALSISLMQPANAAAPLFPFADEIANGRLRNFAVITSGNVPQTMVIALDAADFVTAGAEAPRFEVSDQATLHLEDTAPADITGGTPSPAVPVKSMWQTDSLALRLVWPLNWALRRVGMVAWVTGVTW